MIYDHHIFVLICGTSHLNPVGGIGVVMPGYFAAFHCTNIPYKSIPSYKSGNFKDKWFTWFQAFPVIRKNIKEQMKMGRLVVIYTHAGDGISFFRESLIMLWGKLFGAETVLHIHSPKFARYMESKIQRFLIKFSLRPASAICMLTPWWQKLSYQFSIHHDVNVIANPLTEDLEKQAAVTKTRFSKDSINLLTMARFVPGKGVDIVIEAMKFVPENVTLTLAGTGPLLKYLEKRVIDLNLQNRVTFAGWVSGEEKKKLLESADLFCLPSSYDVFPMSMVEAMSYGLPVVAVKWAGIPDVVPSGKAGILVDNSDPRAIGTAITEIIEQNLIEPMGNYGKKWVLELSSPQKVGNSLKDLFNKIAFCENKSS